MLNVRRIKKRPLVDQVNKFIGEFLDLKYNGVKVICLVCNKPLLCWGKTDCRRHVNSAQHQYKKSGQTPKKQFYLELIFMLMGCNLPFTVLNQEPFCNFWNTYNPNWKLPGRSTLQAYIPSVREKIENSMKSELHNKKLWLCMDKTMDYKKKSVINVTVRTLEPLKPSHPFLLMSKRLKASTCKAITKVVLNALDKFNISKNQVLMLVTDGATTMGLVAHNLKQECANCLHITCKLYVLHIVVEEIRSCYPNVNELVSSTKAIFFKAPERIRKFRKQCPGIPQPPEADLRHWGTWLNAAFYYFEHFHKIKSVVLEFDPKDADTIKETQAIFENPQTEADLQIIHDDYKGIAEAIEKLKNPSLPLQESLQIVDEAHSLLNSAKHDSIVAKFKSIIDKDSDFTTLKQMCEGAYTGPLNDFKEYFNYANITSLDVDESFSAYKNIFTSLRTNFADTTVETYLMLQMFNRANPIQNFI